MEVGSTHLVEHPDAGQHERDHPGARRMRQQRGEEQHLDRAPRVEADAQLEGEPFLEALDRHRCDDDDHEEHGDDAAHADRQAGDDGRACYLHLSKNSTYQYRD